MTDNKTVLVPIGLAHRNYRTFIALELLINVINLDQQKPSPHFRALGYSGGDMKPRRKAVPQFGSCLVFCFEESQLSTWYRSRSNPKAINLDDESMMVH